MNRPEQFPGWPSRATDHSLHLHIGQPQKGLPRHISHREPNKDLKPLPHSWTCPESFLRDIIEINVINSFIWTFIFTGESLTPGYPDRHVGTIHIDDNQTNNLVRNELMFSWTIRERSHCMALRVFFVRSEKIISNKSKRDAMRSTSIRLVFGTGRRKGMGDVTTCYKTKRLNSVRIFFAKE